VDADPSLRAYFQQGAAQGISILSSSGDAGAAGGDRSAPTEPGFNVTLPAAFPEVTAVGGNSLMKAAARFGYVELQKQRLGAELHSRKQFERSAHTA